MTHQAYLNQQSRSFPQSVYNSKECTRSFWVNHIGTTSMTRDIRKTEYIHILYPPIFSIGLVGKYYDPICVMCLFYFSHSSKSTHSGSNSSGSSGYGGKASTSGSRLVYLCINQNFREKHIPIYSLSRDSTLLLRTRTRIEWNRRKFVSVEMYVPSP